MEHSIIWEGGKGQSKIKENVEGDIFQDKYKELVRYRVVPSVLIYLRVFHSIDSLAEYLDTTQPTNIW